MLDQIVKGIRAPRKAIRYIDTNAREQVGEKLNRWRGERVLERDWDNLILLDGCRYDLFAEEIAIDGELDSLRSAGSTSHEYFVNNYDGGTFPEVAYISANTWFHKIEAEFADIIPAREILWDEEVMTVLPQDLTEHVLSISDEYQDKRLVIHYMQPHMPFLTRTDGGVQKHEVSRGSGLYKYSKNPDPEIRPWWRRLREGELTRNEVITAYRETLRIVLEDITPLLEGLQGRTIVSADHGNGFGEAGIYGHPGNRSHHNLVKVPWFIIEGNNRKSIKSADQLVSTRELSTVDEEKLHALGYV
jgi:hypothetical protein